MRTKRIIISASCHGPGGSSHSMLEGFGYCEAGFLAGTIRTVRGVRSAARNTLLTAFTFTGCPIVARTSDSSLNPWLLTDGAYIARRTLDGPGFRAVGSLTATAEPAAIQMGLDIKVSGNLPSLVGIDGAFQESIWEESPGHLRGEFEIQFLDSEGEPAIAKAVTEYHLSIGAFGRRVWRNITILCAHEHGSCLQVEQIDLFGNRQEAERDLTAKLFARQGSTDPRYSPNPRPGTGVEPVSERGAATWQPVGAP